MQGIFKPLFEEDEEKWQEFKKIALSWVGTPFRNCCMVKGRGVDCTLFIGAVLKESGYLNKVEYSYYPNDRQIHMKDEFIINNLYYHMDRHFNDDYQLLHLQGVKLVKGDLLGFGFKSKRTTHAGIYLGKDELGYEQIIQAWATVGVKHSELYHDQRKTLKNIFRIIKRKKD